MSIFRFPRLMSFARRGAKHQFAVGLGLVSTFPLLGLWYLFTISHGGQHGVLLEGSGLLVVLATLLASLSGFVVLRQYPYSIIKLRSYTEKIMAGTLPDNVRMPHGEDDIEAIERGMNVIVSTLRARLAKAEGEKRMLEGQLADADKLKSLGLMATGIAHDFGNMMCVVTGSSQMAMRSLTDPPRVQEFLLAVTEAGEQAMELTQQMMALATGKKVSRTRVNVSAALLEISDLLRRSAGPRNDVCFQFADDAWVADAHLTQLRQVVLNLVINAADATERPGTITLSTSRRHFALPDMAGMQPKANARDAEYVCIEVVDTGCGMDENTRQHIFDAFYTTKTCGRGLGLSVVLSITSDHGGLVGVTASAPGKGSTFRVLLPCTPPPPAATPPADVPPAQTLAAEQPPAGSAVA